MKTKKPFLFIALVLSSFIYGQEEGSKIAESEFNGRVKFIKGNKTILLEQQITTLKIKVGLAGSSKTSKRVKGSKSNVRIKKSKKYQFLIKVENNNLDPLQLIKIFKLKQKIKKKESKNYRYAEIHNPNIITKYYSTPSTYNEKIDIKNENVSFETKKYGKSSYLITVVNLLEIGEYAITIANSNLFNMFGVE